MIEAAGRTLEAVLITLALLLMLQIATQDTQTLQTDTHVQPQEAE